MANRSQALKEGPKAAAQKGLKGGEQTAQKEKRPQSSLQQKKITS